MVYADTSLPVAALARDSSTEQVQHWRANADVATGAVMLGRGSGAISSGLAMEMPAAWSRIRPRLHASAIGSRHFECAAELVVAATTGPSSGDVGYPPATPDRGPQRACAEPGVACIAPLAG